jgi:hypothetical protein
VHAPKTLANSNAEGVMKNGIKLFVIVWFSPKIDVADKAAIIASSLLFT